MDGVWELLDNFKELCLCYFELKCDLIVIIGKEVKVFNNVIFSKDYEKIIIICDI